MKANRYQRACAELARRRLRPRHPLASLKPADMVVGLALMLTFLETFARLELAPDKPDQPPSHDALH